MTEEGVAKRRSIFLINRKFQLKFSFFVCSWIVALSLVYPLIIYDLFEYFISFFALETDSLTKASIAETRHEMIELLVVMHLSFLILTFLMSLFVSHRIAGPIYKLKKSLDAAKKGRLEKVQFRTKDNFKELARSYNEAVDLLFGHSKKDPSGSVQSISNAIARIEGILPAASPESKEVLSRALEDLKTAREKI